MTFDLALFEELDAAYAAKPLKPRPVQRDPDSRRVKARRRIASMSKGLKVDFADKSVLELGCGHGWQSLMLAEEGNAERVVGVDVRSYPAWSEIRGPSVELIEADLAVTRVVPERSIDLVVSAAVLEHVSRPIEMLEALYACLRPGGRAWLFFNLYRGPQASHRYNDVRFPWPHLLFEDRVCEAWFAKHRDQPRQFAWVNRLTLAEYVAVTQQVGFALLDVRRSVTPIDVPFYLRFQDILGRYPALDLESDFATLVLERPTANGDATTVAIDLPYVARQAALREAIGNEPAAD